MAISRTFKLSEDINLDVGSKNINIMKSYLKAPDLKSKAKNVKIQEIAKIQANLLIH